MLRRDKTDSGRTFLLVIRQYHGGPVSFPKGHVEAGESERETAIREVFEETAAEISIFGDFRETISYSPARGVEKEVVYFLATTESALIKARRGEIAEVFWVDVTRAVGVLDHENDRNVFKAAMKYIENSGAAIVV